MDTSSSMFSLSGRVALVTGASRGLGFEIAKAYASAGAQVLINSRSRQNVEEAASKLAGEGLQVTPLAFDVADETAAAAAIAEINQRFGRLDVLVCNVGNRLRVPLDEISTNDFRAHLDVNLTAAYTLVKMAAPLMMLNKYGRIIMLTSIGGSFLARAGDAAYITAKGGLTSLMRAFACEFGGTGINCNAIAPGSFTTETNAQILASSAARDRIAQRVPLKRSGDPSEIAGPAVFLASEASSYVTGHVLTVDGGFTISF
jgi:gluconate 5-dehydrogenase